jgi:hypothetical protein
MTGLGATAASGREDCVKGRIGPLWTRIATLSY